MQNFRRKLLHKMPNNAMMVKSLALALYVKKKVASSTINDFSYNKLANLTGLHINTLKKRVSYLKSIGLAKLVSGKHLVFCSLASSSKHRNIDITKIVYDSVKDVEKCLYALFVVEIQKRKDFVKHTLQSAHNPKNIKEMKKAKEICRRYGYYDKEFKDFGISYKTIAKKLGVCLQKAFSIVEYAIEHLFLAKANNFVQVYCKGIGMMQKYVENNFTFCTQNNIYYIYANTYKVL